LNRIFEVKKMIIGYIGLILLVSGYALLLTKYEKLFPVVGLIASIILTIHAFLIYDIPFVLVNGFISVILFFKIIIYKGGTKC